MSLFSEDLEGFGGWLIFFQIWAFRSIFNLIITLSYSSEPVLPIIFILLVIICMYFFYKRRTLFRFVYIVIAILEMLILLRGYPYTAAYMIIEGVIEVLVITALFMSRRVRNTFS
jgi:hypothetical protein